MPALTFVMFFHTQVHLCTYIHQYTEKKQTPKSSTQSKAVITINFHAMGNLLSHLLRVHMNCTQDHLLKWNRTIPEYSTLVITLIQQNGHWAQVYLGPGPLLDGIFSKMFYSQAPEWLLASCYTSHIFLAHQTFQKTVMWLKIILWTLILITVIRVESPWGTEDPEIEMSQQLPNSQPL